MDKRFFPGKKAPEDVCTTTPCDPRPESLLPLDVEESPEQDDPDDPFAPSSCPDGGKRAYMVLAGSFIGLLVDFGLVNAVGSIQSYLALHQLADVSSASSSLIFSFFLTMVYNTIVFSGVLFDELGCTIPTVLGTVMLFVGLFCTGECESVVSFIFVFALIVGSSLGTLAGPLTGVVSHWFLRNRSKAFGVATLGGSVGGIVFPLLLNKLFSTVGFRWGMRIFAFICTSLLAISSFLIKERYTNAKVEETEATTPTQKITRFFSRLYDLSRKSVDFSSVKDYRFAFCMAGNALGETALGCSITYFASYVTYIGFTETTANTAITVMNASGILGRYVAGVLADRIGCYNVMIFLTMFASAVNLAIWLGWSTYAGSIQSVYCYSVLYGFSNSAVMSLGPSCVGSISPTREFGKRYGTMMLAGGVAVFSGMLTAGGLLTHKSLASYRHLALYSGLLTILGVAFWTLSRYFQVGLKINVKV
ncbi:hypothetical protein OGAPHI_007211 [Ogataea philodendri]|uniref:Major facilitator superfamily (MFS) profile domain-containing protein n=1 Tax=Ogataea philodendri TaxID=1378263 RepID=A0A9P8SZX9_9ASCO|nr:uncharacterized protein OGAPHI_007211 [Ogataea philodendri]KAH3660006.1 hypothetical protein OGAPHI_007211 [Ogataea philodendri]